MNALKRRLSLHALIACAVWYCSITASAAAQDYGHMRVQFGHGSAWTDASQGDLTATLPPSPAHAGYGYAHKAESSEPNDRVRLKASSFNGM